MSTPGGSPNYWRLPPKNASKNVQLYGTTTVHTLYIERVLFKTPISGGVLLIFERDLYRFHGGCSKVAVVCVIR